MARSSPLHARFFLPILVVIGVLMIGVRGSDVKLALEKGVGPAFAETKPAPEQTEKKEASVPEVKSTTAAEKPKEEKAASATEMPVGDTGHDKEMDYEQKNPEDYTATEIEILKQLSDRRSELEKRARDLNTREALIRVTEQRVEAKIKDLETLQSQIQKLLGTANEAQAQQIENLVKIYETMKPKEAAKIFEALDMPVLLQVLQRMKPQRVAPIMAEMQPDKAKEITVALTERDKLPKLKE
jgi:flagellar motility protein MotE (MotC chaperone)